MPTGHLEHIFMRWSMCMCIKQRIFLFLSFSCFSDKRLWTSTRFFPHSIQVSMNEESDRSFRVHFQRSEKRESTQNKESHLLANLLQRKARDHSESVCFQLGFPSRSHRELTVYFTSQPPAQLIRLIRPVRNPSFTSSLFLFLIKVINVITDVTTGWLWLLLTPIDYLS